MAWASVKDYHRFYYDDEDRLYDVLFRYNLLKKFKICPICASTIKISITSLTFRCRRAFKINPKQKARPCTFKQSARRGTIFESSKLNPRQIMEVITLWLCFRHPRQEQMIEITGHGGSTIVDWSSYCRGVCIDWLSEQEDKLGGIVNGEPIVVELDEAKFGKEKFLRGERIEGQWVVGGFERGSKRCFMVPVTTRDSNTLLSVIKDRIAPGTVIVSDCWKTYDCLSQQGYRDLTINHHVQYFHPDDPRIHTENIERTWEDVQGGIPRYGRRSAHFAGYLAEFLFKRAHAGNLVEEFLKSIALTFPPQ